MQERHLARNLFQAADGAAFQPPQQPEKREPRLCGRLRAPYGCKLLNPPVLLVGFRPLGDARQQACLCQVRLV